MVAMKNHTWALNRHIIKQSCELPDWDDHIRKIEQYAIVGSVYTAKDGKGQKESQRQCLNEAEKMTKWRSLQSKCEVQLCFPTLFLRWGDTQSGTWHTYG